MKKIFLISILVVTVVSLFAQISLNQKNNGLIPGETASVQETQFMEPGTSGANLIWDFSKLQSTETKPAGQISTVPVKALNGVGAYNLVLNEGGYEYFYNADENGFEEVGMISNDNEIVLVYTDPIRKMNYPFTYGSHIGDTYSAYSTFKETTRIDYSGEYTVDGDAFGTLILPDRVLKNTLRIKVARNGMERYMCGSTEVHSERYLWYAAGYRYPVLTLSIVNYQIGGQAPVTTRKATLNVNQHVETEVIAGLDPTQKPDQSDVSVILYPNPFNEKLTYNYYLRKDMSVSIDLFDITGKISAKLLKTQSQAEGLHTGEINSQTKDLNPGIYYLRFTFDNKVVTNKIVKI